MALVRTVFRLVSVSAELHPIALGQILALLAVMEQSDINQEWYPFVSSCHIME